MPRKSLRRRRRRSSKKSKKTFTKQLTKRSKSKKIRGGVTTRNGVRRGNYRFLSTLKAQDLTRLNPDIIGEIREMHPLLTTKLNNITLRHAVKDYLSSYVKDKRFIILKYGEIGDWDVSNVTNMIQLFEGVYVPIGINRYFHFNSRIKKKLKKNDPPKIIRSHIFYLWVSKVDRKRSGAID